MTRLSFRDTPSSFLVYPLQLHASKWAAIFRYFSSRRGFLSCGQHHQPTQTHTHRRFSIAQLAKKLSLLHQLYGETSRQQVAEIQELMVSYISSTLTFNGVVRILVQISHLFERQSRKSELGCNRKTCQRGVIGEITRTKRHKRSIVLVSQCRV